MESIVMPKVIMVDDNPSELGPLAVLVNQGGCNCQTLSPDDVTSSALSSADLVVVDLTLDDWLRTVPDEPISRRPLNGIALANVFRQQSDKLKADPPTGYALITGQPEFFNQLPSERRPHVISRLSNFEWFFEKNNPARNAPQLIELTKAIQSLPTNVKADLSDAEKLLRYLDIPGEHPLFGRYKDAVLRCRPPLHHLSERSHGMIIIRWLLHRILPHTCFLLDKLNLAARLRITPDSLVTCMAEQSQFSTELEALKYTGPLSCFDGDRWWRSGVEQWLWDKTEGESANNEAIHLVLRSFGATDLVPMDMPLPVVTVDKDLRATTQFVTFAEAKALRLDDWPDYAEPAYVTTDTLDQHPEMAIYLSDLV